MEDKFDLFAIVELFGHTKIAGRCTEQNVAGTNMLRVDVPETETQPGFTRFFGSGAIYAINPVDEETAKHYAGKLQLQPVDSWNISELMKKHNALTSQISLAKTLELDDDPLDGMEDIEMDDDDDDDDEIRDF